MNENNCLRRRSIFNHAYILQRSWSLVKSSVTVRYMFVTFLGKFSEILQWDKGGHHTCVPFTGSREGGCDSRLDTSLFPRIGLSEARTNRNSCPWRHPSSTWVYRSWILELVFCAIVALCTHLLMNYSLDLSWTLVDKFLLLSFLWDNTIIAMEIIVWRY